MAEMKKDPERFAFDISHSLMNANERNIFNSFQSYLHKLIKYLKQVKKDGRTLNTEKKPSIPLRKY